MIASLLLITTAPTVAAMQDAQKAWHGCLYDYTRLTFRVNDPSEMIADGALTNCRTEEGRYQIAIQRHWSTFQGAEKAAAAAKQIITEFRVDMRRSLVVDVQLHRAGEVQRPK